MVTELVRRRVPVMEWVDGEKVDRLAARFASGQLDFRRMMETLLEVYLRMMLIIALITAITFLAVDNIWLLVAGLVIALFMFVIVLPSHPLENPLRSARGIKPEA
jgi:ABC-type multidrug transport system fused ATPase/permease subunit